MYEGDQVYRCAVRKKVNFKVTGEEKSKTRLRQRKANKPLCREQNQFDSSQTSCILGFPKLIFEDYETLCK